MYGRRLMPEAGGVKRLRTSKAGATSAPPSQVTGRLQASEPLASSDRLHPVTLRFESAGTEATWREYDNQTSLGRIRLTLGLALALYALFAWLDVAIAPEVAVQIGGIRIGVCLLILAVLLTTRHPAFGRWRSRLLALTMLAAGGGIIWMLELTAGRVESLYYVGLILVLMATHAFRWLPFPTALGVSLAVVLGYDLRLIGQGGVAPVVVLNNHFFFLSALVLGAVASYSSERSARMSFQHALRANAERLRHAALLENMLPQPVAERLKDEPGPFAERFDDVSVLFIDMVDFSTHSAAMDPEVLVAELDAVFRELDDIARSHGVEKIKTMGDGYLAVAGLPVAREDHAERLAEMALSVQELFQRRSGDSGLPSQLRMGIACGSVVAGVIGTSKLTYDVWGGTVTLASRMQSHGVPDRIQVTEEFRRRLRHAYTFQYRGLVDVKGRGPTPTWWLLGRKAVRPLGHPLSLPPVRRKQEPVSPVSSTEAASAWGTARRPPWGELLVAGEPACRA